MNGWLSVNGSAAAKRLPANCADDIFTETCYESARDVWLLQIGAVVWFSFMGWLSGCSVVWLPAWLVDRYFFCIIKSEGH